MLDIASIGTVVLFFVGCEWYIYYCERLLKASQVKGGGER